MLQILLALSADRRRAERSRGVNLSAKRRPITHSRLNWRPLLHGPTLLDDKVILAWRYWTGLVFWLVFGCAVAGLVYFSVFLVIVGTHPDNQALQGIIYGIGFLIATVLACIAANQASPARLSRIITPCISVLAIVFPTGLNVYLSITAGWRPACLLYLFGSIVGAHVFRWIASRAKVSNRSVFGAVNNLTSAGCHLVSTAKPPQQRPRY